MMKPEAVARLLDAVKRFGTMREACDQAGMPYFTVQQWISRGQREKRGKFFAFVKDVRKAQADRELLIIKGPMRDFATGLTTTFKRQRIAFCQSCDVERTGTETANKCPTCSSTRSVRYRRVEEPMRDAQGRPIPVQHVMPLEERMRAVFKLVDTAVPEWKPQAGATVNVDFNLHDDPVKIDATEIDADDALATFIEGMKILGVDPAAAPGFLGLPLSPNGAGNGIGHNGE
jgi:hypothetical protein